MLGEIVPESSLVIEIPEPITQTEEEPPRKKTSRSKPKAKTEENEVKNKLDNLIDGAIATEPKAKAKPVRMQTKTLLNKPLFDELIRITKEYVSEMERKLMELEQK